MNRNRIDWPFVEIRMAEGFAAGLNDETRVRKYPDFGALCTLITCAFGNRDMDMSNSTMLLMREQAYVGGRWIDAEDNARKAVDDPGTGEIIGHVPDLNAAYVDGAIDTAHHAFTSWRETSVLERADRLMAWYDGMNEHAEELARLMTWEQGKPIGEARGEVAYAARFLRWFAGPAFDRCDLSAGESGRRDRYDSRAGRRGRHHYAVEFSAGHDHAQGRGRARRGLHDFGQAGQPNAVLRAGAGRTCRTRGP